MKRLFIGIDVVGEARAAAEATMTRLSTEVVHQAVRWVRPDKLHLTLVFLGHLEEEALGSIEDVCRQVAGATYPFTLTLTDLGGFPHLQRPKVVWLGLKESSDLLDLQSRLDADLRGLMKLEDRDYHPHITLGRVSPGSPKVGAQVQAIAESLGTIDESWPASEMTLYESAPDGRYLPIGRYPFTRTSRFSD